MNSSLLSRLRYAHEHLFRQQTYSETKNATVASANLVLLANIDLLDGDLPFSPILTAFVFLCCFVSALIAFSSFFPDVRNVVGQPSAVFFADTAKFDDGEKMLEDINEAITLPPEERDLANQIAIVSKIVKKKTSAFSNALTWFGLGSAIFVAGLFVQEFLAAV